MIWGTQVRLTDTHEWEQERMMGHSRGGTRQVSRNRLIDCLPLLFDGAHTSPPAPQTSGTRGTFPRVVFPGVGSYVPWRGVCWSSVNV
jgi:hypothetical protein